jgi:hypothetical protein
MQSSAWIALAALALGAVCAGGFYYLWPHAHWAVYPVVAVFVAGPAYRLWLEMSANEKMIDRGDWPNK